jgi:hypothetical protein
MTELGYKSEEEMSLFCDNKSAIEIAHNPMQYDQTKYVEVDRHFIKDNLEQRVISYPYVKFENQLADILTKVVSTKIFEQSIIKLGMIDIYLPT